ncbi:unnamed protein product [Closterium sp. NIES-54]
MTHQACGRGRRGLLLMTLLSVSSKQQQQPVVPRTKPPQVIPALATLVCVQVALGAILVIAFSLWSFPSRDSDVLFAGEVLRSGRVNESYLIRRLAASATINTLNTTTTTTTRINSTTTNKLQFSPFRVVVWNKRAQDAVVTIQQELPSGTSLRNFPQELPSGTAAVSIHAEIKSLIDTLRAAEPESSASPSLTSSDSLRTWWKWLRADFPHEDDDDDDDYYSKNTDNTDVSDLDDCRSGPAKSEQKKSGGGGGNAAAASCAACPSMASRPLETDDHDAATTNRNGSNVGIETGWRGEAEEVRGKAGGVSEQEKKAQQQQDEEELGGEEEETGVRHILFNIASSNSSFSKRVRYLRAWWRSENHSDSASSSDSDAPLRGYVWMDDVARFPKALRCGVGGTPPVRVSSSTAHLSYWGKGLRDYVRMARVVVDAYRLGEKHVRWCDSAHSLTHSLTPSLLTRSLARSLYWYVMGDDDTFFSPHALAAFLRQYDHRALLYLGSTSETHMQNVEFTRSMAFGGAGFAVSAALAKALSAGDGMDPCLERHAKLRGSDERVAACIGELGVSLVSSLLSSPLLSSRLLSSPLLSSPLLSSPLCRGSPFGGTDASSILDASAEPERGGRTARALDPPPLHPTPSPPLSPPSPPSPPPAPPRSALTYTPHP